MPKAHRIVRSCALLAPESAASQIARHAGSAHTCVLCGRLDAGHFWEIYGLIAEHTVNVQECTRAIQRLCSATRPRNTAVVYRLGHDFTDALAHADDPAALLAQRRTKAPSRPSDALARLLEHRHEHWVRVIQSIRPLAILASASTSDRLMIRVEYRFLNERSEPRGTISALPVR